MIVDPHNKIGVITFGAVFIILIVAILIYNIFQRQYVSKEKKKHLTNMEKKC